MIDEDLGENLSEDQKLDSYQILRQDPVILFIPGRNIMNKNIIRRILQVLFTLIIQGVILFISAQTIHWIWAWIYLSLGVVILIINFIFTN